MSLIRLEISGLAWTEVPDPSEDPFADPAVEIKKPDEPSSLAKFWLAAGILPEGVGAKAQEMLWHLNEADSGYKSGDSGWPREGEPRAEFDPRTTDKTERAQAKASELRMTVRNFFKIQAKYKKQGITGLVDGRTLRVKTGVSLNDQVELALLEVASSLDSLSDITDDQFRLRIARIVEDRMGSLDAMPSRATVNRAIRELLDVQGTQRLNAKSRRSVQSSPTGEFGSLIAQKPGEFVVLDSTLLDVYALDPIEYQWVRVEMSVAIDVFSRCVLGFYLSPVSTNGADLALLLGDVVTPAVGDGRWPEKIKFPYAGVPENVLLAAFDLPEGEQLQAKPMVKPGTVIVDRGRNYQSAAFMDACRELRIHVQSARLRQGSDKGWVESFFRTLNMRLLQDLPAYKGPNVLSRGTDVEKHAFLTIRELEAIVGEWIVRDYHQRPHSGLRVKEEPSIQLSPNAAFDEGLARAGFLHIPHDPHMRQRLLPTKYREIRRDGVKVHGLLYGSKELGPEHRGRPSPWGRKWPVKVDPRDLRSIWFLDPNTNKWHELTWRHGRSITQPFQKSTLDFVKRQLVEGGVKKPSEKEIEIRLWEVLNDIKAKYADDPILRRDRIKTRTSKERVPGPVDPEDSGQPKRIIPKIDWPLDAPALETDDDKLL